MGDVSPDDLRRTMSRLVSGVSVITARSGRHDVAATVSSLVSVSLEPPVVLFTVHRDGRLRDAVEVGASWAVSILGSDGGAAARWLSDPGRPLLDQLTRIPNHPGEHSGAAILDVATAWLEARTLWVVEAGTHDVVGGEVVATGVRAQNQGAILHGYGRMESWDG
ncbi:flavin reductase family protein [Pseudactinotalea suaedae]|uniref:flavin reductase family protein n=1 Tax=Pseudactinotalea suaedae TaxID=1524924 RepID=UPI0012E0ED57|nr:flavin reductase family protein [Pseudactinotalea suaedae]